MLATYSQVPPGLRRRKMRKLTRKSDGSRLGPERSTFPAAPPPFALGLVLAYQCHRSSLSPSGPHLRADVQRRHGPLCQGFVGEPPYPTARLLGDAPSADGAVVLTNRSEHPLQWSRHDQRWKGDPVATKEDQEVDEAGEEEYEQAGTSINISEDSISIEVPRDGNEGETLSRLAKLVDGLGQ